MKGISAIISIILLVMISVSLAGLAWVWFFNISNNLMTSATSATQAATNKIGIKARIEVAQFYSPNWVNATIRNIGTVNIDMAKLGIFVDSVLSTVYNPNTGMLTPGSTVTINITNATPACTGKVLEISFESGFEDYETIAC
jgi:flagellin-like protein